MRTDQSEEYIVSSQRYLYKCVCVQEGRGSRQEGVASEGAEEEEEDEEDDQEDQEQRHVLDARPHLLHTRQPALAHCALLDMYDAHTDTHNTHKY